MRLRIQKIRTIGTRVAPFPWALKTWRIKNLFLVQQHQKIKASKTFEIFQALFWLHFCIIWITISAIGPRVALDSVKLNIWDNRWWPMDVFCTSSESSIWAFAASASRVRSRFKCETLNYFISKLTLMGFDKVLGFVNFFV